MFISGSQIIRCELHLISTLFTSYSKTSVTCLLTKTQDFRVGQVNESYIELIQENLMELLGTKYPSYILTTVSLCSTTLAYPK